MRGRFPGSDQTCIRPPRPLDTSGPRVPRVWWGRAAPSGADMSEAEAPLNFTALSSVTPL
eukprot:4132081-Pyramimonas_sp.AAC.2